MSHNQSPVTSHQSPESQPADDKLILSSGFLYLCYALIGIGVIAFVIGFIKDPARTWTNYLVNNYYFLALAVGAAFFLALQYITQSGWSSGFKRVPEAMSAYLPFAAVLLLLLYFGLPVIYRWAVPSEVQSDLVILHKRPFLNTGFFMIRLLIYSALWIGISRLLRKYSLKEDLEGGLEYFRKSEFLSRIFIFVIAITFSLACFDLMMSVEVDWASTIYAFRNFASAFYHASAIILLITVILYKKGHFPFFNRNHLQDMSSYVFMLSIFYGYLWFSQFMLIWYGNIPEETIYYKVRWEPQWNFLFYADILINWFIPFVILMPKKPARRLKVVVPVVILLIIGYWIDIYLQVAPAITGKSQFGLIEIGSFLGFAGLFALVVSKTLASAALVPKNHPYLSECLDHHIA
jgi:hypothetical protein